MSTIHSHLYQSHKGDKRQYRPIWYGERPRQPFIPTNIHDMIIDNSGLRIGGNTRLTLSNFRSYVFICILSGKCNWYSWE